LKNDHPRIIIFSGKGGVGKTTVASATALRCAQRGLKTIVISIDIAHSLSDAFQLQIDLYDHNRGKPRLVSENLWLQEVDIQEELDRNWGEVSKYLAAIFNSSGITHILAEELAVIPGMEDVISLLYINQYYRQRTYDVIVVDCAPTGESLRFIGMPSTLDWYMKKIFHLERNVMKVARPLARRLIDIPIPEDSYFSALKDLFLNLEGVDKVLLDRNTTSVRLVTNAEKMVIRETQRAFMYFCLYGLVVDTIVVNKLFPQSVQDEYFRDWIATQQRSLKEIYAIFEPIPVRTVNILRDEVVGIDRLQEMGNMIYGDLDPSMVLHGESPYEINEQDGAYSLRIKLPFVKKDYVDLFKDEGDLVIRIGSFKRHVFLPRALVNLKPSGASLDDDMLTVRFAR
jgi:arsenite-transporting ATPase